MPLQLEQGSRIGVVGGGPAGAFATYFLLDLASRVGLSLSADVYEAKNFCTAGPTGCNYCGGIVSESLVQMLAFEGINLPDTVVQRGIDSYVLHSDVGSVRIATPLREMRIAAVHRGGGPRQGMTRRWDSFDAHLLGLARAQGARVIEARVEKLSWDAGRPRIHAKGHEPATYDLLIGAVGVNTTALSLFEGLGFRYRAPRTAKAHIAEHFLGMETVERCFGSSMHVFLLDMKGLEFAALVPKGEFVTLCLLGDGIDKDFVRGFLAREEVRRCFPDGWQSGEPSCHCSPRLNVGAAPRLFADRVVLIGDSGVARLYKDGIGSAYRTAKACAVAAIFDGVAAEDLATIYEPACRAIRRDNALGRMLFAGNALLKRSRVGRRAVVEMTRKEQAKPGSRRPMSMILWDTFTGSAPYRDVVARAMTPAFVASMGTELARALVAPRPQPPPETPT